MSFYVGILDGANDVWGVRIPDIEGCVGAGETPEAAIADAVVALRDVVAFKKSGGHPVPPASSVANVLASAEVAPGESVVLLPLVLDAGRSVRANLTMDAGLLDAIDQAAQRSGITRSSYVASAAREKLMRA
ncbi:type II toxin-antitoxin system HicB family antitoxin [uncultured Rhodoblastus sp.]|uniref:type II toxin-antitoxin system HicB family antitoxin n=1 Tax=uncultured Rhodoblastus sp. TaxID=543037 RepID=UPI0025D62BA8|nr:type II toxin-antitoxin system HicB family antitoxin [uncultured Rhodoblastus sp.]